MYWYICATDAGHSCLVSSQASTKIFFIGIQDFSRIHGFIPMNASHHGKLWRASLKRLFGNCSHEHIYVYEYRIYRWITVRSFESAISLAAVELLPRAPDARWAGDNWQELFSFPHLHSGHTTEIIL